MKKSVVNNRYPAVRGQFDEASLEVCFDPVLKQKVLIFLLRVGRNPITCGNSLPRKKRSLLLERKVNNLEDIIVKRDTSNPGMSRKERAGKNVCSRGESLGLTHSVEVADTFEKDWGGGCRLGNELISELV